MNNEFKIGDKVRVVHHSSFLHGFVGEVECIVNASIFPFRVNIVHDGETYNEVPFSADELEIVNA